MIDSNILFNTAQKIINESKGFQKFKIKITSKEDTRVEEGCAIICINPHDPIIQREDKEFTDFLIRKEVYKSELRKNSKLPEFLEDIMVNKRIIKEGYGDVVESYYFILMNDHMSINVDDDEKFFKVNIPWISFYGIDRYKSEYFKKLSRSFQSNDEIVEKNSKLIEFLKTPYIKLKEISEEVEKKDANT